MDSEAEERAFRFKSALASNLRCHTAVGGGGTAGLEWPRPRGRRSRVHWFALALGHLKSIIVNNELDGAFFLECSKGDLKGSGIGPSQWKKTRNKMPQ